MFEVNGDVKIPSDAFTLGADALKEPYKGRVEGYTAQIEIINRRIEHVLEGIVQNSRVPSLISISTGRKALSEIEFIIRGFRNQTILS
jgi:hypothetical protein